MYYYYYFFFFFRWRSICYVRNLWCPSTELGASTLNISYYPFITYRQSINENQKMFVGLTWVINVWKLMFAIFFSSLYHYDSPVRFLKWIIWSLGQLLILPTFEIIFMINRYFLSSFFFLLMGYGSSFIIFFFRFVSCLEKKEDEWMKW